MKARLVAFGQLTIDGEQYDHDVVIDAGKIGKRKKKPSKPFAGEYGHTPLTALENLPWGGPRLIVGTGAYGSLPIREDVYEEATRRGVEVVAVKTEETCKQIAEMDEKDIHAVLHITC